MEELAEVAAAEIKESVGVTILGGFLGAGKTTLLKHVLEGETRKIGVVVNDVAAVNVDAKLVERETDGKENVKVIEMKNGCACCSASDDLFRSIRALLQTGTLEHIVVECSGAAEPKRMWSNLIDALEEEELNDQVFLSKLVIVVDTSLFFEKFQAVESPEEMRVKAPSSTSSSVPAWVEDDNATQRYVSDLLVEQLESADLVLLNKTDLVQEEEMTKVKTLVEALCPGARTIGCQFGRVSSKEIISILEEKVLVKQSAAARSIEEDHRCSIHSISNSCRTTGSDSEPIAKRPKLAGQTTPVKTFVYRRRIAFDPKRFAEVMIQPETRAKCIDDKVLRSKGYCWLANHSTMTMYWSQSGKYVSLNPLGAWWVEVPRSHWPSKRMPEEILREFQEPFGDRRQEIVFIGLDLDEKEICATLDACLLSETEMDALKGEIQLTTLVEESDDEDKND